MHPLVEPLRQKLAATRRWWRTTRLLNGLAWAVSVTVLLGLICFHWDAHWTLNMRGRELWRLAILGSGACVLLLTALRTLLAHLPDIRLAADVERRYPILRERLLTALDLAPALSLANGAPLPSNVPMFSPTLTGAVVEEASRLSDDLDFRRAVSLRPLRGSLLTLVFTLLLLALHIALAGPAFANWLLRIAHPKADIAPYARTRVQVIPGATLLPTGEGVWVAVKTWGDAADRCTLRVHRNGDRPDAWMDLKLTAPTALPDSGAGSDERNVRKFRYRLDHLSDSVTLTAQANDGHSNEREVRVAPRPALLGMHLRFHYPAYMHRADKTLDSPDGSFAAPVGSQVELIATTNNPLHAVTCVRSNAPETAWHVDGRQAEGRLEIAHDGSYGLKLTDTNHFQNLDVPHFVIHAEKDQAPTVQISRPAADIDLVPSGSLPLIARATDDYGVTSMRLAYNKTHEDLSKAGAQRITRAGSGDLALPGPDGGPQALVQQRWHIASVGARQGDTILYEVDAVDNDTLDGPHTGRSLAYRVHVVSLTEMQARLKQQLDEEQRDLQQLRGHQTQAQQQLAQAHMKPDAAHMAKAADAQRAVAQETQALSERVQQLSNQLENNEMASESELQRRESARQALQQDAQQKMNAAADAMQQAQNADRSARSQDLNRADHQESAARKEIDRAQDLLARTATPEQLAKEAARLAQEQQQLADSASSLAEDLRAQRQQSAHAPMTEEDRRGMEMERQQQAQTNADTQRLQQQLSEAARDAQQRGDNKAAQELRDAAKQLQKGDVNGNQQQAQQSLDKNSPENASPAQNRAAQALQKAAEAAQKATGQQPTDPNQSAADRLKQAAENLQKLAQQQRDIAAKVGQNPDAAHSQDLARQEQALQQQAQAAQQQLNGAQNAQQSLQNAQQSLGQSSQKLGQNSPQSAKSPAQSAAQQLENAAQQAQNAAQQLAQEQKAQEMQAQVERLAQIQHGLHDATERLDKLRQNNALTGNDMVERRQVAERQESTEKEARSLAQQFPSPAFQQAMRMASKQMHPATRNLGRDEPDTGTQTQSAQQSAARTLDTIARALKQQAQNASPESQQGQQGQQSQSAQSAQQDEAAEALGELMLAQGLQQQLRQDTGGLDKARQQKPDHSLNSEQQQQADQLAEGQQSTRNITRRAADQLQQSLPDAAQAAQDAGEHMGRAGERLEQRMTDSLTQGHQDQAIQKLDQAVQQAQQAMQQQQQQQQAMQQGQQGAPQPMQQKGNRPNKQAFTKLVGAQKGAMSTPTLRQGQGFSQLPPRTQRALREGRDEKVPAEYQELVNRYYKSLAEKQR
jgi:hypothetical protein